MRLPDFDSPRIFELDFRPNPALWQDRILAFAREKNWPIHPFEVFPISSNLVVALGEDLILKVFPTCHRHQWESDRRVLRYLQGRAPIRIARYEGEGFLDNWTYLLMEKIPGRSLEELWGTWDDDRKKPFLKDVGRVMRDMHALPVGELQDLPPEWTSFLEGQIQGAVARHTRLQLPQHFLQDLPAFLARNTDSLSSLGERHVILTGEYTPSNLLADDAGRLHAMIDFGDAMIGPADYDLLGPIVFLCEGKPALVQTLMDAYGKTLDTNLKRRLFLLMLLHRYSNFADQIRIPGWETKARNLEELEEVTFPSVSRIT